ncbi:MAG: hypothetical protein L6R42_010729 [Xanthoria sp. 1 TBL-2021]|nr:MAG: hypothetical protein L6R42_010729 [Xanthoria sp. 1 TBL-2021]
MGSDQSDSTVVDVRIHYSEKGNKGTSVRSSISKIRGFWRRQVFTFQALEDHMLSEVGHISQRLVSGQETQTFRREIRRWEACAVITMLEDHANTVGGLGELVKQTLLQKWQSASAIGLSTLKNNHWTSILVIRGIKPIAQVKGAIRMGLI